MLRRLGIRGKVLAALSVPVLVLFLLAGLVSYQSLQQVQSVRAQQAVLDSLVITRQLVTAMSEERSLSVAAFGPRPELVARADVDEARAETDAILARYDASVEAINMNALEPAVGDAYETFSNQLGILTSARRFVDGGQVALVSVDTSYASVLRAIAEFPTVVADGLVDRDLARVVATQGNIVRLQDTYRHEQVLGREILAGKRDAATTTALGTLMPQSDQLQRQVSAEVNALDLPSSVLEVVTGEYGGLRIAVGRFEDAFLDPFTPETWVQVAGAEVEALNDPLAEVSALATERAQAAASAALREAILTISVTALGVVLSIVIALSIARSIVRPLRSLTAAAGTVRDELPHLVEQVAIPGQGPDLRLTRIPVTSRDEIGRLAAAFNEVNETTIEVAQEQAALRASIAEMFVNVARRDQVLLNRQLSFIDALERSEENPKILADLFRLDHLATRMRRNAESLLVLAGIDTGRRLREALPTSDVIRTASSEIEHYERIQLDLPVDPLMLGHTALPAAHMMAELLENATVFSDPGTPVYVSTGIDDTAVIIAIQDQGLGMLPEELEMANSKIATTSASDVLGSQRLGLYVVGRIAARLGAQVTLSKGPDGKGTLATVRMPLVLFVEPKSIPLTAPTQRQVESFILPEEAAAVVHDTAFAPAPVGGVQDVAAGAYGSAENPAEAVNLAEFVEGTTDTGLPKRRSHGAEAPSWDITGGDTASASAIPLAPTADSLAGAAATSSEDAWQPPMMQVSTPLVARNPGATPHAAPSLPNRAPAAPGTAQSGLPTRSPSTSTGSTLPVRTATGSQPPVPQSAVGGPTASGLPARRPSGAGGPTAPEAVATSTATGPVNVEGRTTMFAGFRSRRAELQAAAVQEAGAAPAVGSADGVERLAAAATTAASFFRRDPESGSSAGPAGPAGPTDKAAPLVVPSLVADDEDFGDAAFAPDAPPAAAPAAASAAPAAAQAPQGEDEPWQPQWQVPGQAAPTPAAARAVTPTEHDEDRPWQPEWQAADAETPEWRPEWPAATAEPAAPAEAPAWQPPVAEPQPAAEAPAWQPTPGPWVTAEPAAEPVAEPVAQAAPAAPAAPQAPAWPWLQQEAGQEPAAAQPPAYAPPTAPVGAPSLGAGQPYAGSGFQSSVDFAELVQGPTRRSMREPKRRGLFRRNKKASATSAPAIQAAPPSLAPPGLAPTPPAYVPPVASPAPAPAPAPLPAPTAPVETPVRQSAWGAPAIGSHAVAEPAQAEEPAWQPPAFQVPPLAEDAPAQAPAPVTSEPTAEQPWAPQWQEEPTAPLAAPAAPAATAAPAAPAVGAWQAPAWSEPQQESWPSHQPPAPAPAAAPGPAAGLPSRAPAAAPASYGGPTSFTPQPMFGFDDEMTSMLAQRADIAQQALAELNQLSTYRPQAVATASAGSLVRRTPGTIPAAPAIATTSSAPRPARDANQVRSLLSSFQSGTSRGRQLADGDDAPTDTGDDGRAGSEEGPADHGEPVTTPDTDLNTRDTTW